MQLSYLLEHARPYRSKLLLIALLSIAASLATLALPWLAGQLIGGAVGQETVSLSWVTLLLVGALAMMTGLNMANQLVSGIVTARVLADLRTDVYEHVQKLPMAFHDQGRQGDLLALLSYEVERLSRFIATTLATTPSMLLTATGAVVLLFWIDPLLALVIPLLVPGFYLLLKIIGRRLRGLAQARQEAEAAVMASAEENLEMMPAIKSFARETIQRDAYAGLVEQARRLHVDEARIYAVLGPAIALVAALGAILLVLFAAGHVEIGTMNPSELFSFLLYAALLTRPVATLSHIYGQFQTARGTLKRLQRVLDTPHEPGYAASGQAARCEGAITYEDVSFTYPGRKGTIRNVNLAIKAGEVVALTGDNGAGKSTLFNLLLGLYQAERGRILLDGTDIQELQVQWLRRQVGYVQQRPLLFNGTIRANIAFGLAAASDRQIECAARLAQAWEFIVALPQGLDTEIGDHGVRLSGGQRQRIALARALVRDPPIIILDEATSMYDLEGEAAFIEACEAALEGRTVILITHRPASLALADRIIVVDHGTIAETGKPNEPGQDFGG